MGNWNYRGMNLNSGNYDVADNNGAFAGTINLTADANGDLNTTTTWTDSSGNQSTVYPQWVPQNGNLSWNVGTQFYNLNCTWAGTPTTFEGTLYTAMFNQNAQWSYGNVFSVKLGNSNNPHGAVTLSKDAGGNLSCLGAWIPNGAGQKELLAVVRWDGTMLSWTTEKYNQGQYVQNSSPTQFSGIYNGASASPRDVTGSWQATQTTPMPKPVEDRPYEQARKKAV